MSLFCVSDIRLLIKESIRKRLMPCEQSDINQQIIRDHEIGFDAVLTGHGNEKILLPEDGNVVYLFRGQNEEYKPCFPSLYRVFPRELTVAEIFAWRMRLVVFEEMLNSHPLVSKFFMRHNFKLDYEGLAQHYGLSTSVLDLTSNLDIALFFAMCWYDCDCDCYRPFDDGKVHEGILYIFCPMRANEPSPCRIAEYMKTNITPIGLQPFLRPAKQKGYALHIDKGRSTKSWAYRFKFTNADSLAIYNQFHEGRDLWIEDILAVKTKMVKEIRDFSFDVFDAAYERFRPKGYSKTKLKRELISQGFTLAKIMNKPVFSEEECSDFINRWNNGEGEKFCDTIGRRPWFETTDALPGEVDGKRKVNIINPQDYRNLKMIAETELIRFLVHPDGPEGAEWVNYMNTPNETHRPFTKEEQQWTKVPAHMENLFSKRYLTRNDYIIE